MSSLLNSHLEKIRYFLAIADSGSFAEAARKLRLAQPTLSQSIKILESATNTTLFFRTSQGIALTPQGQILYRYGKELLERLEQINHALHSEEDPEAGIISIGTKEPYATVQWPRYIRYFEGVMPNIRFQFRISRKNNELIDLLEKGIVDAVMIPDPPEKGSLTTYPLFTDKFAFYGKHAGAKNFPIYTFFDAFSGRKKPLSAVLRAVKSSHPFVDVDSFNVAKTFAKSGLGVALLLESFAADLVAERSLYRMEIDELPDTLFGSLTACLTVLDTNRTLPKIQRLRRGLKQFHLTSAY